ncbi:MAG: Uma2 family endonuclease [Gemmataceae bacterium]|nr:Uma2 family endonuclease [Gemmataceae bacterium]
MPQMAAASPPPPRDPPDKDLYRYGFREVCQTGPDGQKTCEHVPLTLEDVLHPQEGDIIMQGDAHDQDRGYLKAVLRTRLARKRGALVLSDMLIHWDKPGLRQHVPDLLVFFGVRRPKRDWQSFDVAKEGVRPVLLMEITSPATRTNDLGIKVQHYHRAEVPFYIIVDARHRRGKRTLKLIGYRWTPARYEPLPLDERGRLLLEPLGVFLGVKGSRVVLYDAATDEELGDYEAVVKSLEAEVVARQSAQAEATAQRAEAQAAKRRAAKQRAKAQAAEAQVAELEARLRTLEEQLRQRRADGKRKRSNGA